MSSAARTTATKTRPATWMGTAISYDVNQDDDYTDHWIAYGPFGMGSSPGDFWNYDSLILAALTEPSDSIMIGERHNDDQVKAGTENATAYQSSFTETSWVGNIDGVPYLIPEGTRPAAPYPYGPNGAGLRDAQSDLGNFLFCDGHAKAMKPTNTNPDPIHQPQNDLWNCIRPDAVFKSKPLLPAKDAARKFQRSPLPNSGSAKEYRS